MGEYMSPEMLDDKPHTMAIDSWALGVLLYEMLHGRSPFYSRSRKDLIMRISAVDLHISEHISPEAQSLIKSLIVKEPRKRLSMTRVLQHPWVMGITSGSQGGEATNEAAPAVATVAQTQGKALAKRVAT